MQLASRHFCVADRLPVVDRFPAGPRVRLKTVDPPKGNGFGQKHKLRCSFHQWKLCICLKQNTTCCFFEFSRVRVAQHGVRLLWRYLFEALHAVFDRWWGWAVVGRQLSSTSTDWALRCWKSETFVRENPLDAKLGPWKGSQCWTGCNSVEPEWHRNETPGKAETLGTLEPDWRMWPRNFGNDWRGVQSFWREFLDRKQSSVWQKQSYEWRWCGALSPVFMLEQKQQVRTRFASGKSSGDWWLWLTMGLMLILWFASKNRCFTTVRSV